MNDPYGRTYALHEGLLTPKATFHPHSPKYILQQSSFCPQDIYYKKLKKAFLRTYLHCRTKVCWQRCFHCIYQVLLLLLE